MFDHASKAYVYFFGSFLFPYFDSWERKQQIHVLFRFLLAGEVNCIIDCVTLYWN